MGHEINYKIVSLTPIALPLSQWNIATQRKLAFVAVLAYGQQKTVVSGKGLRKQLHDMHLLIGL